MSFQHGNCCVDASWNGSVENGESEPFKDSYHRLPSSFEKLVGQKFFHPKSGHLYHVHGIVFQAQLEEWQVLYQQVSPKGNPFGPLFSHFYEDFTREGRFLAIKGS